MLDKLKVITLNAHSLVESGGLEEVLIDKGIHICLLQETFYKLKNLTNMVNYRLFRDDRVGVRGGGTAIAVHKDIEALVVPIKEVAALPLLEASAVMIRLIDGRRLFCLSVYNRNKDRQVSPDLNRIFEKLCLDRDEHLYIVGGDFNAHHQEWGCRNTQTRGRELFTFVESSSPLYDWSPRLIRIGLRRVVIRTYSSLRAPSRFGLFLMME